MRYLEKNKQALIDYLRLGCKGGDMGSIGAEMEHFIVDEDGDAVPYFGYRGRAGIKDILERLSEFYPEVACSEEGDILGCSRPSAAITIEPAAQIELSIAPMLSIREIKEEYQNFIFRLNQILKEHDYSVQTCGYSPSTKASDMQLIPKKRYELMDEYMSSLDGMHPEQMMRATASLQVSIDFADEQDAIRKMRIASLLGPILSFIADNCPVYEGEPNVSNLCRMNVWRKVDPARCGVVPHLFDDDFCFESYVDWMLNTPPIFINHDGIKATGDKTAAQAYSDIEMTQKDIEHLFSMFWPDVRLKQYVEIRVADALPKDPAFGYLALIKGLFYGPVSLEMLEHALKLDSSNCIYNDMSVDEAIDEITKNGFDACVYGKSINDWIDLLFRIAPEGLGTEYSYLEDLKEFKGI